MQVEQPPKQQIVDRIKKASNILVTINRNPDVDLLVSAIGLTLMLEKLDKSAVAVFSGEIPRAIDFLEPDTVIEENVDSLRDFIIALDKEKADRLRYKVEGDVVRVYITPYKTTITEKDLKFSQGDFNVDLIIALGVEKSEDLDSALTTYGKILHDAQVVTINSHEEHASIGDVDWSDGSVSSYSEMIMSMSEALQSGLLDQPISTALLTGLVSATDRFRNDKTSAKVMTMSAQLMAAGANQQLIASELEKSEEASAEQQTEPVSQPPAADPSTLSLRDSKNQSNEENETIVPKDMPEAAVGSDLEITRQSEDDLVQEAPSLEGGVIDDLLNETNRLNEQQEVPDLSLPPLPGDLDDQKHGGWRDIDTAKSNDEPVQSGSVPVQPAPQFDLTPEAQPEAHFVPQSEVQTELESGQDSSQKIILSHDGDSVATVPQLNTSPINAVFAEPSSHEIINTIGGDNPQPPTTANPPKFTQTATPELSFEMPPLSGDASTAEAPAPEPIPMSYPEPQAPVDVATNPADESSPQDQAKPGGSALDSARATLSSLFGGGGANSAPAATPQPEPMSQPMPEPMSQPDPYMMANPPAPQTPGLPMPDFSTLPPLPNELSNQVATQPVAAQPPQLGLPDMAAATPVVQSTDPAQFRLPGQ